MQSQSTEELELGDRSLVLADLVAVARGHRRVAPLGQSDGGSPARRRREASAGWIDERVRSIAISRSSGQPVDPIYGINTGFGSLAGKQAFFEPDHASELSRRLIESTACGVGQYLDEEVVRAGMLILANGLSRGYSGIRPEVVDVLIAMLNRDVYPAIPSRGSLGASGDLAPLSHLALVISRPPGREDLERDSGEAFVRDAGTDAVTRVTGKQAMDAAGIDRVVLGPKEGLALNAPIAMSSALLALAVVDAENALRTSEIALAMTVEAVEGFRDAFLPMLHEVRGQPGQARVAARVYRYLEGSRLADGDVDANPRKQPPQDAYSVRCGPPVLGAVNDTIEFVKGIVEREINAVQDNPLIFPDLPSGRSLKAVSGGNFHGEYVAMASDFLAIAVTELAGIAERRLFRLNESTLNRHLPHMLIDSDHVGLDCGFMIPQYVAAALVSECKTLAHPDSVDTIPTCGNQEDHVSMSMNAGLHVRQVVEHAETVVAIELWMAAQAIDLRLSGVRVDEEIEGASPSGAGIQDTATGTEAGPVPGGQDGVELSGVHLVARRARHRPRPREDAAPTSRGVLDLIRSQQTKDGRQMAMLTRDEVMYPFMRAMVEMVHAGRLVGLVEELDQQATSKGA